jgi:hypothetical protein
MKELNLRILRPGDAAWWIYNGKVVRAMDVQTDGTVKVKGLTAAQVEKLPCYRCQRRFWAGGAAREFLT